MKIFEYTYAELVAELGRRYGKGTYHAAAIFRRLYHDLNRDVASSGELADSPELAARLAAEVEPVKSRNLVFSSFPGMT